MNPWNLEAYRGLLNGYTELRAQENRSFSIHFLNGQVTSNTSSTESGISARQFDKGSWGFASHPQISKSSVERVLQEAARNAQFMSRQSKVTSKIAHVKGIKSSIDLSTKKPKMSSSEFMGRLKEYDAYVAQKYPDLASRSLQCYQQDFLKEGINSEEAHTYSHYARSYVVVSMTLNSESGPVQLRHVFGGPGQIEDTLPNMNVFSEGLEGLYGHLKNKAKGVVPDGGVKEVILSSKLAGILAHEAIGHTTEGDIVLGGSVAGDYLNQMVASPLVSLVDFAHTALGEQAPMPVLFDDEGTPAEDTVIIENGILKTYMNNKHTAEHFGQKATGHGRAWGFNDEPLVRMRNTAILPGKSKLDDMIASIDDGYFLLDHSNGQADSTSEFMFGMTMGYEIKKGKLGRALLDSTISGVAFDMLKSVSMVSDEMTWVSSGTCGKKQPMTVGMGGPAVKCKIHVGGK